MGGDRDRLLRSFELLYEIQYNPPHWHGKSTCGVELQQFMHAYLNINFAIMDLLALAYKGSCGGI